MKIEHLGIWTHDLKGMRDFYQTYFNMECGEIYENKKKGFSSYFLSFKGGATRIELMTRTDLSLRETGKETPSGLAHLAVSLETREAVDQLTESIRQAGYTVLSEPRITGDGYYESVVADPEGNRIELTV